MEQKRIANILKAASAGAALVGAVFFFWYIPNVIDSLAFYNTEVSWLKWPGLAGMWVIGILCYLALWEFWRICTRIGRDNSFCRENARSMKRIGILALLTLSLIIGGFLFLVCIHYMNGALAMVIFFIVCIAGGIGVVCLSLSVLIGNAAKLKEENDLTI